VGSVKIRRKDAAMSYDPIDNTAPAFGIPVTGSPFTYQNTTATNLSVVVSGGTVTVISYSRDGTNFFPVGLLAGMFLVNPGDYLRVTYLTTPTLTAIPT
jgi:hypothetical protein